MNKQRHKDMETVLKNHKRTREEVFAWLRAARERKAAWEKRVDEKFLERARSKKEAAESGYYDLEWA